MLVHVLPPRVILSIATPAVLGLSFHDNTKVAEPVPSIFLPSAENFTSPLVIVKEALASLP